MVKNLASNKKRIVVGYGRVSSAEQANSHLSLDMQKSECEKKAKSQGYDFIYFEDAGKTGSNTNRKGLKSMLKYVKEHKKEVAYIVVWKLDRLSRCLEDFFADILKPIKKCDCTIASIMENFDDISKVKKVLIGVYIGQAEDELDNIKDRTSSVLRNRAEKGYKLGKAPVGYLNGKDEHNHGIIIPDPDKKDHIKRCYELYATGLFSYNRVGQELAKYGFVDSKGKAYSQKRIQDILKSPVYIGKVTHGEDIFDGIHEPIISNELFYRVQLLLKGSEIKRPKGMIYTYSNFIKCAKCGYSMVATTKHGAHNSGTYVYYKCSNYKNTHLKEKNVNEFLIDEAMQEVIESFDITETEIKGIKKEIFNTIEDLREYEHKSIKDLKKQYDEIVDCITENLMQKNTDNLGVSTTTRAEIIRKLEIRKDAIANKITNLAENSKDTTRRISILIDFANRIPELYLKATLEEKRLILNTITESITYDEDTNTLNVKLRPVFEHLRQIKLQKKKKFVASLESLNGTLETRSESAKQALKNNASSLTNVTMIGTRKKLLNTKIEPIEEGSKKLNVDGESRTPTALATCTSSMHVYHSITST